MTFNRFVNNSHNTSDKRHHNSNKIKKKKSAGQSNNNNNLNQKIIIGSWIDDDDDDENDNDCDQYCDSNRNTNDDGIRNSSSTNNDDSQIVDEIEESSLYNDESYTEKNHFIESFEVVVANDNEEEKSNDDPSGGSSSSSSGVSKVYIYHRLVSLKPKAHHHRHANNTSMTEYDQSIDEKNDDDDDDTNNGITTVGDTFLESLMFSCVGCEPCVDSVLMNPSRQKRQPPKGILKKSNHYCNPNWSVTTAPLPKLDTSPSLDNIPDDGIDLSLNSRSVSFSSIEIKEFKMTLGDHPNASSGPPVQLDWNSKPTVERVISLDEYEQIRISHPRRKRRQLKLSYKDRKDILLEDRGFTREEVNAAWAEALKIRQQRRETIQHGISGLQISFDDMIESFQRKYKRITDSVFVGTTITSSSSS